MGAGCKDMGARRCRDPGERRQMEAVESLIGDAQRRGWAWQVAREARGRRKQVSRVVVFPAACDLRERWLAAGAAGLSTGGDRDKGGTMGETWRKKV